MGESNYQDAIGRAAGGKTPDGPMRPEGHQALLIPEPTNRYDRNAIRVDIEGRKVGYLSRENALAYAPVVKWAAAHGRVLAAEARIIGGWNRGVGDAGQFGVILHVGTPAETLLELVADAVTVRLDNPWAGQLIAFTGDSTCHVQGMLLDRDASVLLATRAGLTVHPRVTKKVQLLVDCDSSGASGNERRAVEYGIPVVDEPSFWRALGVAVERYEWASAPSLAVQPASAAHE